jgi:hypothetical protein
VAAGIKNMTRMIRKQIYIQKRQQAILKRLARSRGLSEAEVIRQTIEREADSSASKALPKDSSAFQEFIKFACTRSAQNRNSGRSWKRDDLYEERLNRFGRNK